MKLKQLNSNTTPTRTMKVHDSNKAVVRNLHNKSTASMKEVNRYHSNTLQMAIDKNLTLSWKIHKRRTFN